MFKITSPHLWTFLLMMTRAGREADCHHRYFYDQKHKHRILRTLFHSIKICSGELKPALRDSPDKHEDTNAGVHACP